MSVLSGGRGREGGRSKSNRWTPCDAVCGVCRRALSRLTSRTRRAPRTPAAPRGPSRRAAARPPGPRGRYIYTNRRHAPPAGLRGHWTLPWPVPRAPGPLRARRPGRGARPAPAPSRVVVTHPGCSRRGDCPAAVAVVRRSKQSIAITRPREAPAAHWGALRPIPYAASRLDSRSHQTRQPARTATRRGVLSDR